MDGVDEVLLVAPTSALLVWFGRWHQLQVAGVVALAGVEVGADAQRDVAGAHLALSTIARRPVNPVATFDTSGAGTMSPPSPPNPGVTPSAFLLGA